VLLIVRNLSYSELMSITESEEDLEPPRPNPGEANLLIKLLILPTICLVKTAVDFVIIMGASYELAIGNSKG